MRATYIGLISDTHGLLRPEATAALEGSQLIIHAGDVGSPEILVALGNIAPVIAVRGNIDTGAFGASLAETAIVEADDKSIYVLHNLRQLDLNPVASGITIIVSGHSHQPGHFFRDGVLYINPGAAGPRRFKLPVTVAKLDLKRNPLQPEFIELLPSLEL
jgi:putative phosphoesterase